MEQIAQTENCKKTLKRLRNGVVVDAIEHSSVKNSATAFLFFS